MAKTAQELENQISKQALEGGRMRKLRNMRIQRSNAQSQSSVSTTSPATKSNGFTKPLV